MADPAPDELEASVPSSARIWNFWLGGKDNFAVDLRVSCLGRKP